ncbi:hypothetical protein D0O09_04675 [Pseudomonas putida]|nr:hypothetical protein D0O09_04675 [Pseudomonas putida]
MGRGKLTLRLLNNEMETLGAQLGPMRQVHDHDMTDTGRALDSRFVRQGTAPQQFCFYAWLQPIAT